jgi:hypothetical protein
MTAGPSIVVEAHWSIPSLLVAELTFLDGIATRSCAHIALTLRSRGH